MSGAPRPGIRSIRPSFPIDTAAVEGPPPFPGGVGVTHLRVYESVGPDGLAGGTPHCHTVCTEAYLVVAGHGRVITVGGDGLKETDLRPGSFVWFTAGTIHRLVNDGGDLEIAVVMANSGLPEAGDMVITLPEDVLADRERYRAAATLPSDSTTTLSADDAARDRRDRAVESFGALVSGGPAALARFHRQAGELVRPLVPGWRGIWAQGPASAAAATEHQLDALIDGNSHHLAASSVHELPPPSAERRYGCCGTLGTYLPG